jgi:hypothetical protein
MMGTVGLIFDDSETGTNIYRGEEERRYEWVGGDKVTCAIGLA